MKKSLLTIVLTAIILCLPTTATAATSYVTAEELYATIGTVAGVQPDAVPTYLTSNGHVSQSILDNVNSGRIPEGLVWRVLAPFYGLYPIPYTATPALPDNMRSGWSEEFLDTFAALRYANIVGNSWNPAHRCTTKNYEKIVAILEAREWGPSPIATNVYVQNIPVTLDTWQGRNSIYKATQALGVAAVSNILGGEDWTFHADAASELTYDRSLIAGICEFSNKRIFCWNADSSVCYHEMGHALADRCVDPKLLLNAYTLEAGNTTGFLREYARSNEHEFAADIFAVFFAQDTATLDKLKEACPVTYALLSTKYESALGYNPENARIPFIDVTSKNKNYDAICWCYDNGIMSGVEKTAFAPSGTVTRAQAVTVLYRMAGHQATRSAPFTDVDYDSWYGPAVAWAYEAGVTSGTSTTTFSPNTNVTREQFIKMCYSLFGENIAEGEFGIGTITNPTPSSWAIESWGWATRNGVVSNSAPQTPMKRGDMAYSLYHVGTTK